MASVIKNGKLESVDSIWGFVGDDYIGSGYNADIASNVLKAMKEDLSELQNVLKEKNMNKRQIEITELIAKGLSNKEIANQLFISEETVKFQLAEIYKLVGVQSRAQLIVFCLPHMGFTG